MNDMYESSNRFPAILIGGPPHTGKSVLARNLKQALKEARIQHYLLRAAPDGEGDWSHDAQPGVVQEQRRKGKFTPTWVERMCRDIARRPLPFLVDVGGRPEPWQETIFDHCTHAILLVKDAESEAEWQAMMDRYNVPVIAVLRSQLTGSPSLETEGPVIRGVITNLKRHKGAASPVFGTLLARVKSLFNYNYDELLRIHRRQAPTDLVVDIPKLYRRLNPARPDTQWRPEDLAAVFDYLPRDTPLALYGIGPAWLYAAVANDIFPNQFYQFDARLGWVTPVSLTAGAQTAAPLTIEVTQLEADILMKITLTQDYLDYVPQLSLPLPPVSSEVGIILDGKCPLWLFTGLTLYYRRARRVAIYYPQLNRPVEISRTKE